MPSPLASLFSTIESAKRVLGDALSNPGELLRSAGANAASRTPEQKQAQAEDIADAFMPAGMVLPASRALSFDLFNKVAKELRDPAGMPGNVFDNTRSYLPKESGDNVIRTVLSDLDAFLYPSKAPGNAIAKPTRLGELIDHPKLFAHMPELQDIIVSHLKGSTATGRLRGQYNSSKNTIQLAPAAASQDLLSTLLHEVQHAIQTNNGMAEGASSTKHLYDPEALSKADKALKAALTDTHTARLFGPKKLTEWRNLINDTKSKAYTGYAGTFGEAEARMTQGQFEGRLPYDVSPNKLMDIHAFIKPTPHDPSGNITMYDLQPEVQKMLKDMGIQ